MAAQRCFHPECFICTACKKTIGGASPADQAFDMIDDNIYHPNCVPSSAIPNCEVCRRACNARSVMIDGHFFHEDCLVSVFIHLFFLFMFCIAFTLLNACSGDAT
jgi:hypothetical protein